MTARRYFEDYTIGEVFAGANGGEGHTLTETDISVFVSTTGDSAAMHVNKEYAKKTIWKTRIAHGALTFAVSEGLLMKTHIYESIEEAVNRGSTYFSIRMLMDPICHLIMVAFRPRQYF